VITLSEEIIVLDCYEVHRIWNYLRKNNHLSVMDFLRQQFPLWEPVFHQVKNQFREMDLEETKSRGNPMNAFEYSAASSFLCEWPEDMDFRTLIQCLRNDDINEIIIWQPFENYSGEYIAGCIDNQLIGLMDSFKSKTS
jgi:ADP-heptose:LPS heptosyltransferase